MIGPLPTTSPHYAAIHEVLARNFTILARDHNRRQGRDLNEVTLSDIYELVSNFEHLKDVVNATVEEDEDNRLTATVEADWLCEEVKHWLEQVYLPRRPHDGVQEVCGFVAHLHSQLAATGQDRR